jgi:fibronectin-binding autotransporter adhesin
VINSGSTLQIGGAGSLHSGSYAGAITNNGSFIENSSAAQTLSGVISGTGSLTKAGTGTLTLANANTYAGGTTLNAGTLAISNNAALGTGTLTFASNSTLTSLTNLSITNAEVISSGATATVNNNGFTLTNSGVISGAGNLTSTGSGTLALTAANTYTGTTTVNSGNLSLGATGALSGTTNVVVNGGTLLLGGSNSINTTANLTLGGGTLSMGAGATRAPAQTFGVLTLTANSIIDFANLSGTSTLNFSSILGLSTNTLSIYDWNGTTLWGDISTTGGTGQTTGFFDASGLTQSELNNISFYSGIGTGFLGNGIFSGSQIIPVPEPSVVITALFLLGWLLFPTRLAALCLSPIRRVLQHA